MEPSLFSNITTAAMFITIIAGMIAIFKFLFSIKDEITNLRIEIKDEITNLKIEMEKLNSKFDLLDERLNSTNKQMEIFHQATTEKLSTLETDTQQQKIQNKSIFEQILDKVGIQAAI